jgi:hypothetical protein
MRITAIIVALNEAPFIATAVAAIYPFVDRIFIQTGYDRSWNNQRVEPDGTVDEVLALPDPDGKISLLIRRIPDEALARNLLMRMDGYDLNHRHNNTVGMQAEVASFCEAADYFWVLDGDEIYDPRSIGALLGHLKATEPNVLLVRGINYFRSWNYVVDPSDNFFQPGFLKPGILFRENRNLDSSRYWRLLFNKYTRRLGADGLEPRVRALTGIQRAPENVAVFHHAAYVGDDARMLKKIRLSVHHGEMLSTWFEDIWQKWTPTMRNIHPTVPSTFAGVKYVPTPELPPIIRDAKWPDGFVAAAPSPPSA